MPTTTTPCGGHTLGHDLPASSAARVGQKTRGIARWIGAGDPRKIAGGARGCMGLAALARACRTARVLGLGRRAVGGGSRLPQSRAHDGRTPNDEDTKMTARGRHEDDRTVL